MKTLIQKDTCSPTFIASLFTIFNANVHQHMYIFVVFLVQSLSCVRFFCDSWTVAPPDSSVHRISQARILVHAKSLQSCPTLCDPTDCSPPGSSVHGTSQARIFLQGIFPAQGLNLYLLHWQEDSLLRATREAHGSYSPMKCFSSIVKVESQNDSDSWTAE